MEDHRTALPIAVQKLLADKKVTDLKPALQLALEDAAAREALVGGFLSKEETFRHNCFKVLLPVAEYDPALLYPHWDSFVTMLRSANSYHRMIAVTFIARLVSADTERRFDHIYDAYFAHLDDESVIVARYVAQNARWIARARPEWLGEITTRLLEIVHTYHNAARRDLLAADVIAFCSEFLELAPDQPRIRAFVEGQAESKSPKARQAARDFMKRYSGA
jgi:hypothetical protein